MDYACLIECGNNISKNAKEISNHKLWDLNDYKVYYSKLIRVYNEYIRIINDFVLSNKYSQDIEKQIIQCELNCWEVYNNFKMNIFRNSFRNLVLSIKDFRQNSPYKLKLREISEIKNELKEKSLEPKEKLIKLRRMGSLYDELENEPMMDTQTLLVIIGIIIALFQLLK